MVNEREKLVVTVNVVFGSCKTVDLSPWLLLLLFRANAILVGDYSAFVILEYFLTRPWHTALGVGVIFGGGVRLWAG